MFIPGCRGAVSELVSNKSNIRGELLTLYHSGAGEMWELHLTQGQADIPAGLCPEYQYDGAGEW